MKKVLITMAVLASMAAGVMVLSSFSAPKQDKYLGVTVSVPTTGPGTCVQVGNCTVSIDRNYQRQRYEVRALNYNSYRVTVNWGAYCYIDGKPVRVGGGTLSVEAATGGKPGVEGATVYSDQEGVYLDDVSVYKCN